MEVIAEFPVTYQLGLSQTGVNQLTQWWEFWDKFDDEGNPLGEYLQDGTALFAQSQILRQK